MAEDSMQEEVKGKFNMGLATLYRINNALEDIKLGFTYLTGISLQLYQINHVKIFFMNAAPLLKKETVSQYAPEIDNLKLRLQKNKGMAKYVYDYKIEKRLFEIVREMEMELKEYFMPSKDDLKGL